MSCRTLQRRLFPAATLDRSQVKKVDEIGADAPRPLPLERPLPKVRRGSDQLVWESKCGGAEPLSTAGMALGGMALGGMAPGGMAPGGMATVEVA
jgi:hypothetical protein